MKKHLAVMALLVVAVLAIFFAGCGTNETTNNGGGTTTPTLSMLMTASTDASPDGEITYSMQAYGASNSDISEIGKVALKDADGNTHDLSKISGYLIGANYFVGESNEDLGEVRDPFSETAQRQFFSYAMEIAAPLNGTYKGVMGDESKEFTYDLESYMTPISPDDIVFGSGDYNLSINGDTITLYNQNYSTRRYLCMIYNKYDGLQTYDRIWASSDIREIDWVDVNTTANFIANDLMAPENGTVRFIVPAGVLTPDSETRVIIIAFNTTYLDADTSGDFRTLVDCRSNMRITATVR